MAEAQPSNKFTLRLPLPVFGDQALDCAEFIQCSETCVGGNNHVSTPSSLSETFPNLQPVSLPKEIVLHILEYLNEPYKLRGCVRPLDGTDPVRRAIIFYKPRLWASIPTFKICSVTRSQAIKRYGRPLRNSLPFDASVDIVSLQTDTCDLRLPSDKFFYCNGDEQSAYATNAVEQLDYNLLDKIHSVEIEGVYSTTCFRMWSQVMGLLMYLSNLKNLHELKIKLYLYDTCNWPSKSKGNLYYRDYVNIIKGLWKRLRSLESLTVLEIEKSKARCSAQIRREVDSYDKRDFYYFAMGRTD
ncbi:hypothetical protein F4803DRAFT_210573 [Xylaria telfairii]|nr:hypothetical protein F4803DRAFT_210573 [Xylaria telfairii]